MAKPGRHPNSLANLRPVKRGDPPLNPEGRNQYSTLRGRALERLTTDLDELLDVLLECARRGDVAALRLALGPILDIKAHQLLDGEGTPVSFADLARRARGELETRAG